MAISDYDGTISLGGIGGDVAPAVVEAIHAWRASGNAFGIATGRDLSMIVYETERWGIPFDFLICCNGAAIYDRELRLRQSIDVPDEIVPDFLMHPAAMRSMHVELSSSGVVDLYVRDARSWFLTLGPSYNEITFDDALHKKNLQQISLAYLDVADATACTKALTHDFGDDVAPQQNGRSVDVTKSGVSKATGIRDALRIFDLSADGLLAIGDGTNDIPMIECYGGFTVKGATDAVKRAAKKIYPDVAAMLRDSAG
ncbi:HAD family hydrolase [Synergistaceae bacterium OttesenSCG-928-I11]|nr:HAD family hydrolase [Synergistaceae bacterium OttesenSCG-928-I11]